MSHLQPGENAGSRPAHARPRGSGLRRLTDSVISLALAVVVFRSFLVEGYMISTGSMAPTLLGFHKQVVCPNCRFEFAVGVAYDDDPGGAERAGVIFGADVPFARCPNCGQGQIDVSQVPRNQGDQLLVHKYAFDAYDPRRWEVVVFRNPYEPAQAYVKRVAGLPGETVDIRHGDVYVDDVLQRKDLTSQRAMRICVYDHDHEPARDGLWQPRWIADPDGRGWQADGHGFVVAGAAAPSSPGADAIAAGAAHTWAWLAYRHWIRSGGTHTTSVTLPESDLGIDRASDLLPLRYDSQTRRLSSVGVLGLAARDRLLAVAGDSRLRDAVWELAEQSHFAPITDDYGYNRSHGGIPPAVVRDLLLSLHVSIADGAGALAVEMTDGLHTWRLVLEPRAGQVRLFGDDADVPLSAGPLASDLIGRPFVLELSLIDRQVLAAIDGEPLLPAWAMPGEIDSVAEQDLRPPRQPVRIGARGLAARVDSLVLYRDVYYTPKGDPEPVTLGEDEFYVLGDNSPVSLDSRRWDQPAVPRKLLLGKPFVVHLPSQQARLRIGETTRHIRIPDFGRIRYIR